MFGFGEGFRLMAECFKKKSGCVAGETQIILKKIIGEKDEAGQNWSRYFDGNVASVNFNPNTGKVNVNRWNPSNANDNLRFRQKFPKENSASADFLLRISASRLPSWKFPQGPVPN